MTENHSAPNAKEHLESLPVIIANWQLLVIIAIWQLLVIIAI